MRLCRILLAMANLIFQILDWDNFHEDNENGDKVYRIQLFGKTKDDQTVYLQVEDYTPFFYIEIDTKWQYGQITTLIDSIKNFVRPKEFVDDLIEYKLVKKHKFKGFTNNTIFHFLQLIFRNQDAMRAYERVFSRKQRLPWLSRNPVKFSLYESNIDPLL